MNGLKHEEKRRKNGDGDNCNDSNNDNNDKAYNDVDNSELTQQDGRGKKMANLV